MGFRRLVLGRRRGSFAAILLLAAIFLSAGASGAAGAVPPAPLWTKCTTGSGAGQCTLPRGIAVDATSGATRGYVYVADQANRRIDEFTAWGEFVRAWGWDVVESGPGDDTIAPEDQFEICVPPPAGGDVCKQGVGGGGTGQFFGPPGGPPAVAVDGSGDVYVGDEGNYRIEKFNADGEFLLMFGGDVNKTKVEAAAPEAQRNLCPVDPGDVCQVGNKGAGKGQFGELAFGPFLAVDAAGVVYVGDQNRIQTFGTDGHYLADFPDPEGLLVGKTVQALAIAPSGGLFMTRAATANVLRLDATGHKTCTATVPTPNAVASDPVGNLYVASKVGKVEVLKFGSGAECPPIPYEPDGPGFGSDVFEESTGLATGSACLGEGEVDIYMSNAIFGLFFANSFVRAYGQIPNPVLCPPPKKAPEIKAQYAISATSSEAVLGADINAHYFTGGAGTTYYHLQYGTAQCVDGGGWGAKCVKVAPGVKGAKLSGAPSDDPLPTAGIFLSGLAPGTTYRYRFVVESLDRDEIPVVAGQPVVGEGGEIGIEGKAGTFRTFRAPESLPGCTNEEFRGGAGAALPDCRAYEMVSPVDKEGGDVVSRIAADAGIGRLDQSAGTVPASGVGLAYSSYRAFGAVQSAPFVSQYLARRHPAGSPGEGWSSEPISPPQEGEFFPHTSQPMINNLYKYFSANLSEGWLQTFTEPVLGVGGQAGFANLYRHNLGAGGYEGCTTSTPQEGPRSFEPVLQGISEDGGRAIFRAADALTPDANPPSEAGKETNFQIYACDREVGKARGLVLVSVMPDGTASQLQSTAGVANTFQGGDFGRVARLGGALSGDGERVFWTGVAAPVDEFGPGSLFVRLNPEAPESAAKDGEGNCVPEPGRACTLALWPSGDARYWGAASDGSKALFTTSDGDLYLFDVEVAEAGGEARTLIAHEALGVLGQSEDASRVYFASEEDLDGGGPAVAGKPNLYLYDAGTGSSPIFIGLLSKKDAGSASEVPTAGHAWPHLHTARISPGGKHLVFTSDSAELAELVAGYDNTDRASGEADMEVYRYAAVGDELACISCNPSGTRPIGRPVPLRAEGLNLFSWQAARIPGWVSSLYAPRALSNGGRVFFESFDPLVLADTNGKEDVYEWEEAGMGSCVASSAAFVETSGGCLYLISAGTSKADSEFVDASADGADVFIRTAQGLLPQDPGLFDIYDARAGGGLPPPPTPKLPCEGEACQSPPGAPEDPTPASSTAIGRGNVKERSPKPGCPKGKHRAGKGGKGRCVAKHKRHHRRAQGNGRAAR